MNEVIIDYQGKKQKVLVEIIDRKIWFKLNDQVYSYDLIDLSYTRKNTSASLGSSDKIIAPMPGKVTKVLVSNHQSVKKGEALLVMEAMKMEYTLKSDTDATVEKINAQVGQQVNLGHLLIQLKPTTTEVKSHK